MSLLISRQGPASHPENLSRIVLLLTGLQSLSATLALLLAGGYAAHTWITDWAWSCELDQVAAPLLFTGCAVVALGLARGRRAGVAIAAVLPAATQAWMLLWQAPLYDWPMQVFVMPLGELTGTPYPAMMFATDLLAMSSIPLGVLAAAVAVLDARYAGREAGNVRHWLPSMILAILAIGALGMYELSFWIAELGDRKTLLFISGPAVRDRALAVAGAATVAVLLDILAAHSEGWWGRWAPGAASVVLLVPAGWDVWEQARALLAPQGQSYSIEGALSVNDWTNPVSRGLNIAAWQATALVLALAVLLGIARLSHVMRRSTSAMDAV
ncbi:hypothetical protein [Actinomadura sp. NEAU-AAG7]|uniref:hypothetical protein n=1 Tax=Actinomadura sp. NEAU-AAG7 TaxID=2839640 RepID=UPI001BE3D23E|nr:hypothetical protein [Actinomadura sp. NEAU-AAG7]MBT2213152.1 hypothetical protein [Actinomadura sp. NEAU-AAG7]